MVRAARHGRSEHWNRRSSISRPVDSRNLARGFPYFAHHDSVSALWSQKWRAPCEAGIYPFTDGRVEDVAPIFAELSKASNDDPAVLYRLDHYAKPFIPVRISSPPRKKRS